jgi:hypothetical protein
MAGIDTTAAPEGGQPLPCVLQMASAAAVRVVPDHRAGMIVAELAIWPAVRAVLAPDVAFQAAADLVAAVSALSRGPWR